MDDSSRRHSRQILFAPIGAEGQRRLGEATVGLVGLGALGATLAELVVRAGIGRLIAVDRDVVEPSNLHRQGLYDQRDAEERLPKAVAAARALRAIDSEVEIDTRVLDLDASRARETFEDCDLILDGTDGFETRYLVNDLSIATDTPWIYGACVAATGMTATILPGETPCLACLFPEPPPAGTGETCDTAGIIAPAATIVASLQMTEALKLLTGRREALRKGLLSFDLWPFRLVEIGAASAPRPDCRACGRREFTWLDERRPTRTVSLCGRNSVQIVPGEPAELDLEALGRRLEAVGSVARNDFVLTLAVDGYEITVFRDGRGLVKGTTDTGEARSAYQRYVGL